MACPPEAFWDLITSVKRIVEFSPECAAAWWVDGFPTHAGGGRFEGHNRREAESDTYEWTRPCDVVAYDPPLHFAYTLGEPLRRHARDALDLPDHPERVRVCVEQQFEHLPDGLSGLSTPG